jgi:hypothetical protein
VYNQFMKLAQMFPKRYATGEDLQGKPVTLTIAKVSQEKMHPNPNSPAVDKWVIYFEKAQKGIVLSRTLAYQIAEAIGSDETADWGGKRVTLYPEAMLVAGQKRVAIRARKPGNEPDTPPKGLAEDSDEEDD